MLLLGTLKKNMWYNVLISDKVQGASWETDVFEMDITEQVEGVEAWVGGN